jgi:hypothetical protein
VFQLLQNSRDFRHCSIRAELNGIEKCRQLLLLRMPDRQEHGFGSGFMVERNPQVRPFIFRPLGLERRFRISSLILRRTGGDSARAGAAAARRNDSSGHPAASGGPRSWKASFRFCECIGTMNRVIRGRDVRVAGQRPAPLAGGTPAPLLAGS